MISTVSLVIFTCENREHLLRDTYESFLKNCDFKFANIILAIDGKIDSLIVNQIMPQLIIQQNQRSGYVKNIINALKVIDTPYFFWLEDDWKFNNALNLEPLLSALEANREWCEIVLSKTGPLTEDQKIHKLSDNLYQTTFGFSANPCLCNTQSLQAAFKALEKVPKGSKLGEDGFENFLSKKFAEEQKKCVILDPVDHIQISHEGYLESTPRNFHMTNSVENKTKDHLLILPAPSMLRKVIMAGKLLITFTKLAIFQLFSSKIYEYCFRVIKSSRLTFKDE